MAPTDCRRGRNPAEKYRNWRLGMNRCFFASLKSNVSRLLSPITVGQVWVVGSRWSSRPEG